MRPKIRLVALKQETNFVPLGVLGYCLTQTDFLKPVFAELALRQKTVEHEPAAKLQDLLVGILAGCRAVSQINTRIRPDRVLARAWGRGQFAEQSLVAGTLDAFDEENLHQLRQGSMCLLRREGRVWQHKFAQNWLWLDIDLTPLPISKLAEASTKGKFAKKTAMVGNWPGCMPRNIMKRSFLSSIQASKIAAVRICRSSQPSPRYYRSRPSRSNAPSCVQTPALAVIGMSIRR